MLARYREFRKFGHGRVVSILHAPTIKQVLFGSVLLGIALGIWL
jgi:hypothetical protein